MRSNPVSVCLAFAAFIVVGLAGVPVPAFAQGHEDPRTPCADDRSALDKLIAEFQQIQLAQQQGVSLGLQESEAEMRARQARDMDFMRKMNDGRMKESQSCPKPKVEVKGDAVHAVSIPGYGLVVVFSDDLKSFNSSPTPLKTRSFLSPSSAEAGADSSFLNGLRLAVIGEVGFSFGGGATVSSFQGGVRFTMALRTTARLEPFAQVVAGMEHCGVCQYNAFSWQPGFGLRYALTPRLGVVGQFDIRLVPSSENELLFSGGVSFALGK